MLFFGANTAKYAAQSTLEMVMDSDRYCDYSKELVLLEMKRRSICEKNGLVGYTGCTESYMKYADK